MYKRIVSSLLALTCIGPLPTAYAAEGQFANIKTYGDPFRDVPSTAWYMPYVKKVYEAGLMDGVTADTFSPSSNITQAQAMVLAARIHAQYYGKQISPSFGGAWYTPYVQYLVDSGICPPDILQMKLNAAASRNLFAILMSILPQSEYTPINTIAEIPDVDLSEDTAFVYMQYNAGIMTGSDGYGTFHPNSSITRAEVATTVARLIDPSLRQTFTLEVLPNPKSEAKAAYKRILSDLLQYKSSSEKTRFGLIYLDEDDIPELVYSSGQGRKGAVELYTFKNQTASRITSPYSTIAVSDGIYFGRFGELLYHEKQNDFMFDCSPVGTPTFVTMKLEGINAVQKHVYSQSFRINPNNPNNESCWIDDKPVSEATYEQNVPSAEDYSSFLENSYELTEANIDKVLEAFLS